MKERLIRALGINNIFFKRFFAQIRNITSGWQELSWAVGEIGGGLVKDTNFQLKDEEGLRI